MTDKVTLTFYHDPRDKDSAGDLIDASIDFFEDLKKRGYSVFDFVAGSHDIKEDEQ